MQRLANRRGHFPGALAEYLDADESVNPWMQESMFGTDLNNLNEIVFIAMIFGYVAHLAYLQSGEASRMSEVIAEADENISESIVDYGRKFGLVELATCLGD